MNYAIIDDDRDMLPEQLLRFVHTNGMSGMTIKDVLKVIGIFDKDNELYKDLEFYVNLTGGGRYMTALDRYLGCLIGLAIGDAVGTTLEFKSRGTFVPINDMVGGGPFKLKPGQWTDDTSMALCLANSLIEKGFDAHDQMVKYIKWWKEGYMSVTGYCFDIGSTTSDALEDYYFNNKSPYCGSTDKYAAGNGGLMRIAPVVMYYKNYEDAINYGILSTRVTHGSPACIECSEIFIKFLHSILNTGSQNIDGLNSSVTIERFKNVDFITKNISEIKGSGYVVESLEAALWCFYNTNNFKDAILTAANLGDDADTTAAIVGQIAGAYYGYEAIPLEWRQKVYWHDKIVNIAKQLLLKGNETPVY